MPPEATTESYAIVTFQRAELPNAGGLQNTPGIESAAPNDFEVTMAHEHTVSVCAVYEGRSSLQSVAAYERGLLIRGSEVRILPGASSEGDRVSASTPTPTA